MLRQEHDLSNVLGVVARARLSACITVCGSCRMVTVRDTSSALSESSVEKTCDQPSSHQRITSSRVVSLEISNS
jgi:hypothetical protein